MVAEWSNQMTLTQRIIHVIDASTRRDFVQNSVVTTHIHVWANIQRRGSVQGNIFRREMLAQSVERCREQAPHLFHRKLQSSVIRHDVDDNEITGSKSRFFNLAQSNRERIRQMQDHAGCDRLSSINRVDFLPQFLRRHTLQIAIVEDVDGKGRARGSCS